MSLKKCKRNSRLVRHSPTLLYSELENKYQSVLRILLPNVQFWQLANWVGNCKLFFATDFFSWQLEFFDMFDSNQKKNHDISLPKRIQRNQDTKDIRIEKCLKCAILAYFCKKFPGGGPSDSQMGWGIPHPYLPPCHVRKVSATGCTSCQKIGNHLATAKICFRNTANYWRTSDHSWSTWGPSIWCTNIDNIETI